LAYAWRDNPIAIAEGATGAQRIYLRALEQLTAGDLVRSSLDGEISVGMGESTNFLISFIQSGTVRFSFEHRVSIISITRTRQGIQGTLSTFPSPGNVWTPRSVDVSVLPGDTVRVIATNTTAATEIIRLQRVSTSGADIWPAAESNIVNFRPAT
jgi:hypothetical protein